MLKNVLPRRLKRARAIQQVSQRELARRAGVAPSTIASLENGQAANTSIETLWKICLALRVSFDYLLLPTDFERTLAPRYVLHTPPPHSADRTQHCQLCGSRVTYGEPHMDGECMRCMDQKGYERAFIANIWGYTVGAIDAILDEEYRRVGHQHHKAIRKFTIREPAGSPIGDNG